MTCSAWVQRDLRPLRHFEHREFVKLVCDDGQDRYYILRTTDLSPYSKPRIKVFVLASTKTAGEGGTLGVFDTKDDALKYIEDTKP